MENFPVNRFDGRELFFSRSNLLEERVSPSEDLTLTESQKQVDGLVGGFAEQATDWRSLAAMMAGGMAYRFGRIGVMASGVRGGRLLSLGVGLGTEVTTFEMAQRSLTSLTGEGSQNPNLWRWSGQGGIRQGLLSSLITFGSLKGAGRLAQGENMVVQHLLQDTGMVLGHQVSASFGITDGPRGTLTEQFLHAEAMNLQLCAGMALARGIAPAIQGLERGLDLSIRLTPSPLSLSLESGRRSDEGGLARHFGPTFAMAGNEKIAPSDLSLPDLLENLNTMQMTGRKDPLSGQKEDLLANAPLSVKKLAEEIRESKGTLPGDVIKYVTDELLEKAWNMRSALTLGERKFLQDVANRGMDEFQGSGYYPWFQIFFALHDVAGLRRLEKILGDNNFHKWQILMALEDYETLFPLIDRHRKLEKIPDNSNWIFHEMDRLGDRVVRPFSEKRGFHRFNLYSFDAATLALTTLSHSYDLVVAIAKGGLFSGAVADFLGLNVRVIEVHAHDRKVPISKFIDEIRPEEIVGKRILLVDKDTVTGASIREAVKLLAPYGPASFGVFFNYDVGNVISEKVVEDLRRFGVATHYFSNIVPPDSLPLFYQAHEKLGTPLGKFRRMIRGYEELAKSLQDAYPAVAREIRYYVHRQKDLYFFFNPLLPGVDRIREVMRARLENLLGNYWDLRSMDEVLALQHLKGVMKTHFHLPQGYGEELARGRYHERAVAATKARHVENIHVPHSYTASFRAAQKALKDKYDVALIVGPEGFAYESIFRDLGLPTMAVNIPEADFGGRRSIAVFDDLSRLKGKRVLVVEDDVQSGATLQKLLDEIKPYDPRSLGLYLGLPAVHQRRKNIPADFRKIYITEIDSDLDEAFFLRHLQRREVLFKEKNPSPSRGRKLPP